MMEKLAKKRSVKKTAKKATKKVAKSDKKFDSIVDGRKVLETQYYTELIFFNRIGRRQLPDKFWRLPKYKSAYPRVIKCVGALLKSYSGVDEDIRVISIKSALLKNNVKLHKYEKDLPLLHYFVKEEIKRQQLKAKQGIVKKAVEHLSKGNEQAREIIDTRTDEEKSIRSREVNFFEMESAL